MFFHLHRVTTSHPLATFFGGRLCCVLFVLQNKDLRRSLRVVSRRIHEQIMCIYLPAQRTLIVCVSDVRRRDHEGSDSFTISKPIHWEIEGGVRTPGPPPLDPRRADVLLKHFQSPVGLVLNINVGSFKPCSHSRCNRLATYFATKTS